MRQAQSVPPELDSLGKVGRATWGGCGTHANARLSHAACRLNSKEMSGAIILGVICAGRQGSSSRESG